MGARGRRSSRVGELAAGESCARESLRLAEPCLWAALVRGCGSGASGGEGAGLVEQREELGAEAHEAR